MKKLILSIAVVGLLASCGSKEKEEKGHDEKAATNTESTAKEDVEEAPQSITMNGYDFLKKFKDEGDTFLNSLKGKEVIITEIAISNASMGELTNETFLNYSDGFGYSGELFSSYSDADAGKKIVIDGKTMAQSYDILSFILSKSTSDFSEDFINSSFDAETATETFHTSVNISVPGDNLSSKGGQFVNIEGATIKYHKNF